MMCSGDTLVLSVPCVSLSRTLEKKPSFNISVCQCSYIMALYKSGYMFLSSICLYKTALNCAVGSQKPQRTDSNLELFWTSLRQFLTFCLAKGFVFPSFHRYHRRQRAMSLCVHGELPERHGGVGPNSAQGHWSANKRRLSRALNCQRNWGYVWLQPYYLTRLFKKWRLKTGTNSLAGGF